MQSGREEEYAIKFCFKLGKMYRMLQTAFRPSCMNQASVFECHKRFKEGRESVRECFKGVQEEIPSEEASTLQIDLVVFLPRQYTSP